MRRADRTVSNIGEDIARIAREALWFPLAVVVFHAVAGRVFGHEPYVDPVAHTLGGIAMAFFFHRSCAIGRSYLGDLSRLATGLLTVGLVSVVALLWELGELMSDVFLGTNIQRSAPNTLRDLTLGLGGAVAYVVFTRVRSNLDDAVTKPDDAAEP